MKFVLKPRPLSLWLDPIEFGVIAVLIASTAIVLVLAKLDKRVRRIEKIVVSM